MASPDLLLKIWFRAYCRLTGSYFSLNRYGEPGLQWAGMGVGFDFAVQRAVLRDEDVAGKAIESPLAVSIESLGQAVGAHPRGKVGE